LFDVFPNNNNNINNGTILMHRNIASHYSVLDCRFILHACHVCFPIHVWAYCICTTLPKLWGL